MKRKLVKIETKERKKKDGLGWDGDGKEVRRTSSGLSEALYSRSSAHGRVCLSSCQSKGRLPRDYRTPGRIRGGGNFELIFWAGRFLRQRSAVKCGVFVRIKICLARADLLDD